MSAPLRPELPSSAADLQALKAFGVPAIALPDPCRTCEEECDGLEGYGKNFEIDYSARMIESCNGYGRLVVCSTQGKADWPRAVTEEENTLEFNLDASYKEVIGRPPLQKRISSTIAATVAKFQPKSNESIPGVHPSSRHQNSQDKSRSMTILSGSHWSETAGANSCLVFPDYKIVHGVQNSRETTDALAKDCLSPEADAFDVCSGAARSYVLPYRAVLLVCSHKRRDKRCHIAAPLLIAELKRACEDEGWDIDEHLDHIPTTSPLEDFAKDDSKRQSQYEENLRSATTSNSVAIVKVSHIGGHRFAGNVICCFPSGANVWYGRVTPRECEAIVKYTIGQGKVIQELARGGVGLVAQESVLAW